MTTDNAFQQPLARRSFLRKAGATGLAAAGGAALLRTNTAAIAAPRAEANVSFTLNDMPLPSDKVNSAAFQRTVAAFEKANPTIQVVGKADSFDPTTFYAHYAAGNVEDTYKVYFTDVQHIIQLGYAKDISSQVKSWDYYSSIAPSVKQLISNAKGQVFGLPVDAYALGLCYNQKLFLAAGLDPNKPPTTWDQFRLYAKKLTDASKGRRGFAPLSIQNTGGWHLTAMIYSFGGQPEIVQNGRTIAAFNGPAGVKALQLLYDMRWTDGSISSKELGYNGNTQELATEQIAMGILAGDQPPFLKTQYKANLNDFILAGLPQGGGNATLTGGDVQLIKPSASAAVTAAALAFTEYRYFDLAAWGLQDKALAAGGGAVGIPANIAYGGLLKSQRDAIDAQYANVPVQNYKFFTAANNTLRLTPEPRTQAQKMYAQLDLCVQAVLSDQSSNPKELLDNAAKQFQAILDAPAS
jgi:ABC-type glycerol-3-phosphate transport system substrate-binding protein